MHRDDEGRDEVAEDWFEQTQETPPGYQGEDVDTWFEAEGEEEPPRDRRPLIAGIAAVVVVLLLVIGLVRIVGDGDDDPTLGTEPGTTATTPTGTGETTTLPTEPSVTLPEDVTLQQGDENDDVALLQQALLDLGYDVGEPDGIFGPGTQEAVQQFQADTGLEADGIAGPETLAAMNEALASGA